MKRFNPLRPALFAAAGSILCVGAYAFGFRGSYRAPAGGQIGAESSFRMLVVVFTGTFIFLYCLQLLGVKIQIFGSQAREDDGKGKHLPRGGGKRVPK